MRYTAIILNKIDKSLNNPKVPNTKKDQLRLVKTKLKEQQYAALKIVKDEYLKQQKDKGGGSQVQEANVALPLAELILLILGMVIISTAVVILLHAIIVSIYQTIEETKVEDDVGIEDIDITDVLPDNVTLPENNPKPGPGSKPYPVILPIGGGESKKEDDCTPKPLGWHRGGDQLHNYIADVIPPNKVVGTDWELKGKAFDAYSTTEELWEVKTANYSNYAPFIRSSTITGIILDAQTEYPIATGCGFHYVLGVTDKMLYNDLLVNPYIVSNRIDLRLISIP